MKRRKVLKGIVLFSLGTGMLFSCKDKYQAIKRMGLKHFSPIREELDVLALLSESIVPLQIIPELENHSPLPFIFEMMDNVYSSEDRIVFEEGYRGFNQFSTEQSGVGFTEMNPDQRNEFVNHLNSNANEFGSSINGYFKLVKGLNIQYLKTSEYYQKRINYYEMEPGRFKGDILLKDLKNRNVI